MGPLSQTPTDVIVPLTMVPYMVDQSTMCQTCVHADDIAGEVFYEINQSLDRQLAMEDTVLSTRSTKACHHSPQNKHIWKAN
jgi:hypothetical protein